MPRLVVSVDGVNGAADHDDDAERQRAGFDRMRDDPFVEAAGRADRRTATTDLDDLLAAVGGGMTPFAMVSSICVGVTCGAMCFA